MNNCKRYQVYWDLLELDNKAAKEIANSIAKQFGNNRKVRILDLGIGAGAMSVPVYTELKLKNKVSQIEWIGIDIDKNAWNCGKNIAEQKNYKYKNINFYKLDIEGVMFELSNLPNGENFDVIFAPTFFHHLIFWEDVLDFCVNKLNANGLLIDCAIEGDVHLLQGRWELVSTNDSDLVNFWKEVYNLVDVKRQQEIDVSNYGALDFLIQEKFSLIQGIKDSKKNLLDKWISGLKYKIFTPYRHFNEKEVNEILEYYDKMSNDFKNKLTKESRDFRIWQKKGES